MNNNYGKTKEELQAYVNLFKVIFIGRKADGNMDMFSLLEGDKKLEQLIKDIKTEKINIFIPYTKKAFSKYMNTIYTEMKDKKENLTELALYNEDISKSVNDVEKIISYIEYTNNSKSLTHIQKMLFEASNVEVTVEKSLPEEAKEKFNTCILDLKMKAGTLIEKEIIDVVVDEVLNKIEEDEFNPEAFDKKYTKGGIVEDCLTEGEKKKLKEYRKNK